MDIIIVGAGVAGSALAYSLAKDGRRVQVIERDLAQPDRMVGEFLLPGGYLKLIDLGLEDCVNEIDAQQVFGYILCKDGKRAKLSYPLEKFDSNVAARSFHNGLFIQRMRKKAASLSNVKLEQGTVKMLIEENGIIKGVIYKTKAGEELKSYAPLTIVCDGCCSNLRRTLCKPKVEFHSYWVGMTLENYECPSPIHAYMILADPSFILFYPISSTEIRCFVDIPGQKVPSIPNGEMFHFLKTKIAPQVPGELYDAFISAIKKDNLRIVMSRSMAASPNQTPGAILIGDALNMRNPFSGGGMTVALSDVILLRDLLRPLQDLHETKSICSYLQSFQVLRKPMASTINILADISYKVLSGSCDHPLMKDFQGIYFDYLKLGGKSPHGPTALLSGLCPRPWILLFNLFALTVYAIVRLLLPFPSPQRIWSVATLILKVAVLVFRKIKAEGFRKMFLAVTMPAYLKVPSILD